MLEGGVWTLTSTSDLNLESGTESTPQSHGGMCALLAGEPQDLRDHRPLNESYQSNLLPLEEIHNHAQHRTQGWVTGPDTTEFCRGHGVPYPAPHPGR